MTINRNESETARWEVTLEEHGPQPGGEITTPHIILRAQFTPCLTIDLQQLLNPVEISQTNSAYRSFNLGKQGYSKKLHTFSIFLIQFFGILGCFDMCTIACALIEPIINFSPVALEFIGHGIRHSSSSSSCLMVYKLDFLNEQNVLHSPNINNSLGLNLGF